MNICIGIYSWGNRLSMFRLMIHNLTQPQSATGLDTQCPDEVLESAPESGQELNLKQTEPLENTEVKEPTERYS